MTITRIASVIALSVVIATPAAAQRPPVPPAPPAAPAAVVPPPPPPAPPAPPAAVWTGAQWHVDVPDLSHIQLPDFSHIELPDLSHIELPDLSHIELPDLSHIQVPDLTHLGELSSRLQSMSAQVALNAQTPLPAPFVRVDASPGPRQYDGIYDQARAQIDQNQYDRAISDLDRLIAANAPQAPGAMYWKAYSLARIARRPDALTTLADLRGKFPKSPWVKDAQALEVELKQATGQAVDADAQNTDDLKLLALRGLMQTDPESAFPIIEKMIGGGSSVRVKDRALFVVSQSRSTRARALLVGVAKGNDNPDLQLRAIRYIGQMGGGDSAQTLDEVYRTTSDERVKREIIRGLGNASSRERLLALAKNESSADLRGEAVRALGNMRATTELEQLYRSESSQEVKKRILQGMQNGSAADKLAAIARTETDAELKRLAILYLGNVRGTDALTALYAAEQSEEVKGHIISALGSHNASSTALVTLARAEKNPRLKERIVSRLSTMRTPEARDYLLELLK